MLLKISLEHGRTTWQHGRNVRIHADVNVTLHDVLERRRRVFRRFLCRSRSAQSLLVKTRFTWELQTGTENFNSLASLIDHGLITFSSIKPLRKGVATAAEQSDYRQVRPTTFRTLSIPT